MAETPLDKWIRDRAWGTMGEAAHKAAPAPLARCDPGPNPCKEGLSMDTIRHPLTGRNQTRRETA